MTIRHLSGGIMAGAIIMAGAALQAPDAAAEADYQGICCLQPDRSPQPQPVVARGTTAEPVLTFQGLQNLEEVLDFYAGGVGGDGSGPGPDYGITFSGNAQSIISQTAGGSGNFTNNPSGDIILFFLTGTAATMNVPDGFENGFAFYYSACCDPGEVVVYDGPDGTGNVLANINLPTTPTTPDTPFDYDNWQPVGVQFAGVARSVDFGGVIDRIGFDNITLGTDVPGDPDPGGPGPGPAPTAQSIPALSATAIAILLLIMLGIAAFATRR